MKLFKGLALNHKSTVLIIRWLVVLLVIFMAAYSPKGLDFNSPNYLLSLIYLILNLAISFIPQRYFDRGWFVYLLFVLDIIFVSAVIYFAEGIDTDFYLIYFLSIFMSSVGQSLGGSFPVAIVTSLLYGWLVYKKYGTDMFGEPAFWLRIPFFFLIAMFSSFWSVQVAAERKKKEQAEEFSHRLQKEIEQATEEYLKANENLKYFKEYNDNIMASINSGVIVVDINRVATTFNKEAVNICQLVSAAVVGKSLREYEKLKPIDDLLKATMEHGNPLSRKEMVLTMENKSEKVIDVSTSLLHSQTTRTNGAIAIFSDISKTKSLEERVKNSEKLAVLGEMAAVMAHEIRNPLNAIAGFSQLLQTKVNEADPRRKYVDIVTQEAFRIDTLISDILDFAHQKKVANLEVNVEELADRVIAAKSDQAKKKGVSLTKQPASNTPAVMGDAVRLERILLNLVNNAIDAMDQPGNITIKTERLESDQGPLAHISVQDSGCGIPPENLKAIFKPFFTTKSAGTGLGLAIIQKIAEEHHGIISVESEIGKGTTFNLTLPAVGKTGAQGNEQ
ncbi:PAS domain-containing protein [candidate division TA06 bacterium]|uniref:histidine kinase n=1 Tax=candidate division TA06 bacterium TaxID=2250710 RepID=A0A933I863_UNCT6|nr:PAS domain-containing protein [candidate division TA06 bacterium]